MFIGNGQTFFQPCMHASDRPNTVVCICSRNCDQSHKVKVKWVKIDNLKSRQSKFSPTQHASYAFSQLVRAYIYVCIRFHFDADSQIPNFVFIQSFSFGNLIWISTENNIHSLCSKTKYTHISLPLALAPFFLALSL